MPLAVEQWRGKGVANNPSTRTMANTHLLMGRDMFGLQSTPATRFMVGRWISAARSG
jgi:hypothetical protein